MDTKWKNTKKTEWKIRKHLQTKKAKIIIALICGILGIWLFLYMWKEWFNFPSRSAWAVGGILNVLLGIALFNGIRCGMEKRYQVWDTFVEDFFQKWKKEWKKQQKFLIGIALGVGILSIFMFKKIIEVYYWYGYNYSVGYVTIGGVLIQFIVAEATVIRFMLRLLNHHIADMEALVEQNVEKAMEQAIQSERLKVDLISNVSHDLKTPLTSMVGYIELIKKEEVSDVVADYVEVLGNKAQKLKEMIDSLFDLAKTSSGNIEFHMEKMELNRLIEQVQADMEDKFTQANREVVAELTEENTEFTSDSSYMYRICQNLMENALKYSAEHTRIFLKTARVEKAGKEMVRFEITNTANYRMNFSKDQIVERFARADKARTTEGNGLGLAIVSTYTSALGGLFEVEIDCDQFKAIVEFPVKENAKNALQSTTSMI